MYKLTQNDYLELYPYFLPEEIKEEFGKRSHSARTIRQIYSAHNLPSVTAAQNEYIQRSYGFSDTDSDTWQLTLLGELLDMAEMKKNIILERIRIVEGTYSSEFFHRKGC